MKALSYIFEYGASLFDAFLCVWFITRFNKKSFSLRQNPYWIPAVAVIFGYTVVSDHFLANFNVLSTIIFLLLYITYAVLIEHKKWIRSVFSAVTFEIALVLINTTTYNLISFIIKDFEASLQWQDNYNRFIFLFVIKIALWSVCKLILFAFKADTSLDIKNGLLSFVFSLITIFGLSMTIYIATRSTEKAVQLNAFLITLAFLVLNILLYIMIVQVIKLQKDQYDKKALEEKISYEQKRYDEVTTMWSDIRKTQHDMKHQLAAINGYLEEQQYEECKEYVAKLLPNQSGQGKVLRSDNNVIDYIINAKLGNLKETVILVTGSIGDISDIEEADLASLLGNLLDNAVEAIADLDEKRIELTFAKQDASRVIICKNTIKDSVIKNNPNFITTKKDASVHGFGMKAIKRIVKKYEGLIDFFEVSNMFGVQIVLPPTKCIKQE